MNRTAAIVTALLAVVGLSAAAWQLSVRVQAEAVQRTVALAVDYQEVRRLAALAGTDVAEVLRRLRRGATHVALPELTWDDLRRLGLIATYSAAQLPGGYVPAGRTVVHIAAWNIADTIADALARKGLAPAQPPPALAVHSPLLPGGRSLIVPDAVAVSPDVGLGYDPTAVAAVRRANMALIARPRPAMLATPKAVRGSLALARDTGARIVIFTGNEVVGNPAALSATAAAMRDLGLLFGRVEMSPQFGADALARLLDGAVLRVHSISELEMHKLSAREAIQRYVRAVRERNVRVLYVRLLPTAPGDILEANARYLGDLRDALQRRGFAAGDPSVLPDLTVPVWTRAALGAGAAAVAVGLLAALGLLSNPWWAATVFAVAAASVGLCTGSDLGRHLVALATVVAGAAAVLVWYRPPERPLPAALIRAVAGVVLASVATAAAAAVAAALLSDRMHMTATALFRGVKLSLLLPPLVVLAVQVGRATQTYWQWATETGGDEWPALRAGLGEAAAAAVRYWHVVVAAVLLAAAALLVVRSGNEPLFGLSGLELKARAALEALVGVRPRTKEFAVGHPLLLLGLWLLLRGRKRAVWLLLAGGAIGQASLANTFCHIHTPYLLSLQRAAAGLVGGVAVGLVLVGLWWLAERCCRR